MIVNVKAKIVTCRVYDKKDKQTKEPTGEKGISITLLVDEDKEYALSGKVISPYVEPSTYRGIYDFSLCGRLEPVVVEMDMSVGANGKEFYKLFDLERIEKKK